MIKRALVCLIAIAICASPAIASVVEDINTAKEGSGIPASPLNTSLRGGGVLYDNGPLVTNPGAGAGGADISLLSNVTLLETTLGYGHQLTSTTDNRIADDFTITDADGWNIDSICFYAYQSFAGSDTITGVNLQIWDGDPSDGGSSVVFGDTTTNLLASTGFANTYRMSETAAGFPNNTDRHVQLSDATVGTTLGPGTYWLDWQSTGSAGSGPWAPPVSFLDQTNAPGANGMQSIAGVWGPALDGGSGTPDDFPFLIKGSIVPEPGSALLLLMAAVSLLGIRRR